MYGEREENNFSKYANLGSLWQFAAIVCTLEQTSLFFPSVLIFLILNVQTKVILIGVKRRFLFEIHPSSKSIALV